MEERNRLYKMQMVTLFLCKAWFAASYSAEAAAALKALIQLILKTALTLCEPRTAKV